MYFFDSALKAWTRTVRGKDGRDLDLCARQTAPSDLELRVSAVKYSLKGNLCAFILSDEAEAAELRKAFLPSVTVIGQKLLEGKPGGRSGETFRSITDIIDIARGLLGFEFSSQEDEKSIKAEIEKEANGLQDMDPDQVKELNDKFDQQQGGLEEEFNEEKENLRGRAEAFLSSIPPGRR